MKINPDEQNIHITAKCDYFEVYEIVPEKKTVKRLEQIRSHFMYLSKRKHSLTTVKSKYGAKITVNTSKLIVTTGIHNPKLF